MQKANSVWVNVVSPPEFFLFANSFFASPKNRITHFEGVALRCSTCGLRCSRSSGFALRRILVGLPFFLSFFQNAVQSCFAGSRLASLAARVEYRSTLPSLLACKTRPAVRYCTLIAGVAPIVELALNRRVVVFDFFYFARCSGRVPE